MDHWGSLYDSEQEQQAPLRIKVLIGKPEAAMPHYFFHVRTADRMHWDRAGLNLPDLRMAPDPEMAAAIWAEVLAMQAQPDRILVVTDEAGQTVFVTAL
jgi:hypothetical protein